MTIFKNLYESVLTEKIKIDSSKELHDAIEKAQDKETSIETDVNGKRVIKTGDNPEASGSDFDARKDSNGNKLNLSGEKSLHKIALLNSGAKGDKGKLDFDRKNVEVKIGKK